VIEIMKLRAVPDEATYLTVFFGVPAL